MVGTAPSAAYKTVSVDQIRNYNVPTPSHGCVDPETAFLAPKAAPLVHILETSVTTASQATHRAVRAIRQEKIQASAIALYSHLENDPQNPLFSAHGDTMSKRSYQLSRCRKSGYYARHIETGKVKVFRTSCKIRWCALCGSALNSWRAHTCSDWLVGCNHPKFTTLTTQHTDTPLDSQLKSLYRYFHYLCTLTNFRKYVRGGIWFLQIKRSAGDHNWHPHLHCLFDSAYYPHAELVADWQRASRGSTVVDIRKVRSHAKAVNDVVRYSASAADLSALSLDDGVTVYRACHGKRLCGTWGTAKGVQLKPPRDENWELWERLAPICLITDLHNSHAAAKAIYEAARDDTFLSATIRIQFTDDIIQVGGGYRRRIDGEWNEQTIETS